MLKSYFSREKNFETASYIYPLTHSSYVTCCVVLKCRNGKNKNDQRSLVKWKKHPTEI